MSSVTMHVCPHDTYDSPHLATMMAMMVMHGIAPDDDDLMMTMIDVTF